MGPPTESRTSWVAQTLVLPEHEDVGGKLRNVALRPFTADRMRRVRHQQPWNCRFTLGSPLQSFTQQHRWPDAAMQFTPSTPTRLPFNEPFAWTRPGVAHRSFLKALVEEDSKVQAQF